MIFGKKCMVVSAGTRNGKDGKVYGNITLSDGKDTIKFDCESDIAARVVAFREYDCFVEMTEEVFGDKAYNRRRVVEVREPEKVNK